MRHAQFASAALTLAVLLASCGQQPTVSPSTSSSQNSGQTNLSTQSAAEKFRQFRAKVYEEKNPVLLAKIQKLPERMRKNVIFIDGERMYSNNSQLLKEMQQFKQLEGERWVDEQGQSTQMPAFAPTPASLSGSGTLGAQATNVRCKTDNSGPFSRVLAYPGYSWFIGDVTLPDSYNAQQATGDSVHLYTGGWSTSAAVDGGYQRNADGRYQAILRATYTGYSGYAAATPHHFRAGRGNLEFFTWTDGSVWLHAYGYWEERGIYDTVTIGFSSVPGFNAEGNGVQLKFTTSIAQPANTEPTRFTNGSYVYSQWSNLYLGDYNPSNGYWNQHQWTRTSYDTEEVCSNPSPQTYPYDSRYWNRVSSAWASDTAYNININLR